MKLLISPSSVEEASVVARAGGDIIDIKNVLEGSLGAQPPWVTKQIITNLGNEGAVFSLALGDLPNKPGTVGLAAYGAAQLGVHYIKAGLYGVSNAEEAGTLMSSVTRSVRMVTDNVNLVACGYADFKLFGGVSWRGMIDAAIVSKSDTVMLDTATKDGNTLFDYLSEEDIRTFVEMGHDAGMGVALAGSIGVRHLDLLRDINPDIIGVRGAVCEDYDRMKTVSAEKIKELLDSFQ